MLALQSRSSAAAELRLLDVYSQALGERLPAFSEQIEVKLKKCKYKKSQNRPLINTRSAQTGVLARKIWLFLLLAPRFLTSH
jgi:hypothetical protein